MCACGLWRQARRGSRYSEVRRGDAADCTALALALSVWCGDRLDARDADVTAVRV